MSRELIFQDVKSFFHAGNEHLGWRGAGERLGGCGVCWKAKVQKCNCHSWDDGHLINGLPKAN